MSDNSKNRNKNDQNGNCDNWFREESYQVVGSQEADPMNGRISEDSPFGKALLGNAVGDEVQVEAPAGVLRYRILEIQKSGAES